MVDYFAERKDAKKERIHKNELQRLRNIGRQMKARGKITAESTPLGISKDLQERSKHEVRFISFGSKKPFICFFFITLK